jgi:basic amino acid/polyamine antiporter, APA family
MGLSVFERGRGARAAFRAAAARVAPRALAFLAVWRFNRPVPLATLFRRKPIGAALADSERPEGRLTRSLGAFDLTMLGVGAIVGAGIFSSVGQMAAGTATQPGAGPALVVSYIATAIACGFAALCYAEIAALVPVSGSAYGYAYVALGELVAWIIGWDLVIEYAVGNIYVAQSWAEYFRSFLRGAFGVDFPAWMATDLQTAAATPAIAAEAPRIFGVTVAFNLPAILVTALITALLVRGVRETARGNAVMVGLKLLLVCAFVAVGAAFVEPAHWQPFAPNGWRGIWTGASLAFFSYIGFDAVSTAAEETRDPQRNLPRGMIGSLVLCTFVYVAVAAVMTGLVPAAELGTGDPLAHALRRAGLDRLSIVMAVGAVVAVTSVLLVFQYGQARIFMAMARDGLLPGLFGRVHPRFRTPATSSVLTGLFVATGACVLTPDQALELTSIGTLFAFIVVSVGVVALRRLEPERPRPFRCPGYPVTPVLSVVACAWLMAGLPASNWLRFGAWLAAGGVIYAFYGRRRSRLAARDAV